MAPTRATRKKGTVTLNIPLDLLSAVRKEAVAADSSASAWVRAAIREKLQRSADSGEVSAA